MTTATYPIPNGPGRAFTAAIVSFLVADMFVDQPVGPVHGAFDRHLVFGYLASIGDPATEAERVAAITVKANEALETVRKYGLEPAAWEALAFVQGVGA